MAVQFVELSSNRRTLSAVVMGVRGCMLTDVLRSKLRIPSRAPPGPHVRRRIRRGPVLEKAEWVSTGTVTGVENQETIDRGLLLGPL